MSYPSCMFPVIPEIISLFLSAICIVSNIPHWSFLTRSCRYALTDITLSLARDLIILFIPLGTFNSIRSWRSLSKTRLYSFLSIGTPLSNQIDCLKFGREFNVGVDVFSHTLSFMPDNFLDEKNCTNLNKCYRR